MTALSLMLHYDRTDDAFRPDVHTQKSGTLVVLDINDELTLFLTEENVMKLADTIYAFTLRRRNETAKREADEEAA